MIPKKWTLLVTVLVCLGSGVSAAERPNIVVILADDMGYGDVAALNADSSIPTPNLDRLASQGMTFTDAHTPSAVCTPTRYGLLTGRYCWRTSLKRGVLNGYGTPLIARGRPTLGSLLHDVNYDTAVVGKWHLGLDFAQLDDDAGIDFSGPVDEGPNTRGFTSSFIIPASLDFPPYVFIRDGAVTAFPPLAQEKQSFPAFLREGPRAPDLVMETCLDDLLEESLDYISSHADNDDPFFLYFALTAPHKPVLPHPRFRGKTKLGPYGDFIVQVDWTVGEVLARLEAEGIAENTLVVFTSDNGSYMYVRKDENARDHADDASVQAYRPEHHRSNYVFRGTKADIFEGGHHVPFFVRWPGRIEAGSSSSETICLTDMFATLAEVTGQTTPAGTAEDSYSFYPLLLGESRDTPRPPVIHHSALGMFAIRDGAWKLVLGNGSGGRATPLGKPFARPYQLFNLVQNLTETDDQMSTSPAIADRLEQVFDQIRGDD